MPGGFSVLIDVVPVKSEVEVAFAKGFVICLIDKIGFILEKTFLRC